MKVAVLVKQVPRVEEMELIDGRLRRDGVELEMNAYCRRAVSKGVELAQVGGGRCTVFTLGPPLAEDVLREAVAWGADEGVLITDPAFVGSDTLATARALAAAIRHEGLFDLILLGRNSIDADTGQVGPELAEILDLPFVAGIRSIEVRDNEIEARCELDDGWRSVRVAMPAVISAAERLTEPCKVPIEGRAAVAPERIRRLSAADLGAGPWGLDGSPTVVGPVRMLGVSRRGEKLFGTTAEQVHMAVARLRASGAITVGNTKQHLENAEPDVDTVSSPDESTADHNAPILAVIREPGGARTTRELLGEAAVLARHIGGAVVAVDAAGSNVTHDDLTELGSWGADRVLTLFGTGVEEDIARSLVTWTERTNPWAILAPGTLWGREVAGRAAAAMGAGLTGDAVGLGVEDGRLVCWKPAFGGQLVAAITVRSEVQFATVRPGVFSLRRPRNIITMPSLDALALEPRGRIEVLDQTRDDQVGALLAASVVVAVGSGVSPDQYDHIDRLCRVLGAELAATRKVTDKGWLPRGRQIGITGHSLAPALYVAIGVSGKFNHMVGVRGAGVVLAINNDAEAPVFECADIGIVGDWQEVLPLLVDALR